MFKCDVTGKTTQPGEPLTRVVVERRERVYRDEDGRIVGQGWEIVRELNVSPEGLDIMEEGRS